MPDNASIFLLGLMVGTALLVIGLLVGFWLGRRNRGGEDMVDRRQFLDFLKELSQWTSEFSGDVSKYQSQLSSISEQVQERDGPAPKEELVSMVSKIMQVNQKLQERLDLAEERLESQTGELANYLQEARTDSLTKLQNRRSFDRAMEELFAGWHGKSQVFSLGLIDIDHFKKINDGHGHQAGDFVLQQVANQICNDFPSAVCVARYGGEEFAVLMASEARVCASGLDKLRSNTEQLDFSFNGVSIPVTLSAGASEVMGADQVADLIARADEALYAAKLDGRNRVYLHDGTICRLITQVAEQTQIEDEDESPVEDEALSRIHDRLKRIVEDESQRVLGR